jgi:hypothetical protein
VKGETTCPNHSKKRTVYYQSNTFVIICFNQLRGIEAIQNTDDHYWRHTPIYPFFKLKFIEIIKFNLIFIQ